MTQIILSIQSDVDPSTWRWGEMPIDFVKIRRLRKGLGLTQEEAAAAAFAQHGSKQVWSFIESGRDANMSLTRLEKIAKALGVNVKELIK